MTPPLAATKRQTQTIREAQFKVSDHGACAFSKGLPLRKEKQTTTTSCKCQQNAEGGMPKNYELQITSAHASNSLPTLIHSLSEVQQLVIGQRAGRAVPQKHRAAPALLLCPQSVCAHPSVSQSRSSQAHQLNFPPKVQRARPIKQSQFHNSCALLQDFVMVPLRPVEDQTRQDEAIIVSSLPTPYNCLGICVSRLFCCRATSALL